MSEGARMHFVENYYRIRATIPDHVTMVAVSKFHPESSIRLLYEHTGHRDFGENRAQEMIEKTEILPGDIRWHFIGHLQTNKVRIIVPQSFMIHGVDSYKLLKEVNKEGRKIERKMDVLLQFHIATEETKFGLSLGEARDLLEDNEFSGLEYIQICGVMGMASFTDDWKLVQREFATLRTCFEELKNNYFPDSEAFKELSMGMSGDYLIAIDEGSTMVRIGSLVFGERKKFVR